jgi:hypothetical protein
MTDFKECPECGRERNLPSPEKCSGDFMKVVCAECGHVEDLSTVRIKQKGEAA